MFSLCAVCGGQDNRPDKDDGDVDAVMMFYGKNRRDCCLLGKKKKRESMGENDIVQLVASSALATAVGRT